MYIFSIMLYQLTISISRIQYGTSYILEPYVKTCQLLIWSQTLANEKTYIINELECKLFPSLCIPCLNHLKVETCLTCSFDDPLYTLIIMLNRLSDMSASTQESSLKNGEIVIMIFFSVTNLRIWKQA
jgi:hypothetical protein